MSETITDNHLYTGINKLNIQQFQDFIFNIYKKRLIVTGLKVLRISIIVFRIGCGKGTKCIQLLKIRQKYKIALFLVKIKFIFRFLSYEN